MILLKNKKWNEYLSTMFVVLHSLCHNWQQHLAFNNTAFICDFRILNEGIVKVLSGCFYASKMWFIGILYQLLLRPGFTQLFFY